MVDMAISLLRVTCLPEGVRKGILMVAITTQKAELWFVNLHVLLLLPASLLSNVRLLVSRAVYQLRGETEATGGRRQVGVLNSR